MRDRVHGSRYCVCPVAGCTCKVLNNTPGIPCRDCATGDHYFAKPLPKRAEVAR